MIDHILKWLICFLKTHPLNVLQMVYHHRNMYCIHPFGLVFHNLDYRNMDQDVNNLIYFPNNVLWLRDYYHHTSNQHRSYQKILLTPH